MFFIIFILFLVVLGIILVWPKLGTFIIWIILFTYPHGWWYYRGFLPLNIGADDLFCIALFLAVVIRRNFIQGVPIRFGYAFWVIGTFSIIGVIANYAGSLEGFGLEQGEYMKDILKNGVYFALFYAVLHCIDDEKDLKIQFTMFSIAAVIGALLVIIQRYFPDPMSIFALPQVYAERMLTYESRAEGAFTNPNAAACVLVCSLVLVVTALRLQRTAIAKLIVYLFIIVLLAATLFTQSRSGLLALGGTFILMSLIGKNRKTSWLVIGGAVVVILLFGGIRETYMERVAAAYDPHSGQWGANVLGRIETWRSYFETANAKDYIFGQGPKQGIVKNGMESHSAYVSLITVYGFGAIIWAILSLIFFLRKVWQLRRFPEPLITVVSSGCFWALVAWGIYATTSDAITSAYPRYLLFYIVVLIDRASFFAGQQQRWWLYEEGTEQEEGALEPAGA